MKGTGAKRNVCPGSCVSTGATFPVAPVESAPMSGHVPHPDPHAETGEPMEMLFRVWTSRGQETVGPVSQPHGKAIALWGRVIHGHAKT